MFDQFTSPFRLKDKGIMGMNKRNHSYIGRYNDRSKYPLVDDKLKTKIIAEQAGGLATNGRERVLSIKPERLHQRVSYFVGSKTMMEQAMSFMK